MSFPAQHNDTLSINIWLWVHVKRSMFVIVHSSVGVVEALVTDSRADGEHDLEFRSLPLTDWLCPESSSWADGSL